MCLRGSDGLPISGLNGLTSTTSVKPGSIERYSDYAGRHAVHGAVVEPDRGETL
jgi:hypothetical protein